MTESPFIDAVRSSSPPGYRVANLATQRARESRFARQLLGFAALLAATVVGLWHELGLRQPLAYLEPGHGLSWWTALGSGLAGAVTGAFVARRLQKPGATLPWLMLATALVASGSGFAWFGSFTRPGVLDATAVGVPYAGCGLATLTLVAAARALWFRAAAIGVFERAIDPGFCVATTIALGTAAGAMTVVGFLRAATLLGMTLATLAIWATTLIGVAERQKLRNAPWIRSVALLVFVASLLAFSHGSRLVTVDDLRRFDGAIVYASSSPRNHYVVTSGQASFALFVDDRLELSTLDGYRYAEALVHPAMTIAPRRSKVAVLGGGKWLVEREVLRYDDVEHVAVVTPDGALPRLARGAPWTAGAARSALRGGRLEIVVDEPIAWLDAAGPQYDVIIVDVPDPVTYGDAKNYTWYFYSRLRARLGPRGIAVAQVTSPFSSPETHRAILATARAADLAVLPYRAPLPTFGEWGFALLARTLPAKPRSVRGDLSFLDGPALLSMFAAPIDANSSGGDIVNRLYDMTLLDIFAREARDR